MREGDSRFVGYDYKEFDAKSFVIGKSNKNKEYYQLVLSNTPFMQKWVDVGDMGMLKSDTETITILDTKKENNLSVHITATLPKDVTEAFTAGVNLEKRAATESNHSATHLLHEALREVLGTHVEQKGSFVSPESLRFDFSHFQKMTKEEIRAVEKIANQKIRKNYPLVETREMPIGEAQAMGAMALFGEKYGETVRVVQFGTSAELCGGTHVQSTGNIGMVRIISESSIAAGIRRIEAITGEAVEKLLDSEQDILAESKEIYTTHLMY